MKLVVLAGAKQGTEIPLKKEKFIIGRASDCTLRAGSEAISRHHCLILRVDGAVTVRDLGSRNGTHVNGLKIEGETPLNHGDQLRVGPLEFRCEGAVAPASAAPATVAAPPAEPAPGEAVISSAKRPKVKDIADAVARSAAAVGSADSLEDDISRWLLEPVSPGKSMRETVSFRMDETRAVQSLSGETPAVDSAGEQADTEEATEESTSDSSVTEAVVDPKTGKKKPGKLPTPPPKPQSKDSREAAVQILRDMARRR